MARFTEQFVQQVLQATDIVELISQYVALKRKGREMVGLCPFHDDKRPSLNVSPSKQIFKCFACGAGGDAFKFLILYEKHSFPEAVRALAERAHIPLPAEAAPSQPDRPGMSRNDLLKVVAFAADFYRRQLKAPGGREALNYIRSRGLTDESIERFGLGYAPDAWDGLLSAAAREGFTRAQMTAAGLAARKENTDRCYDRFRHRLMFPILDLGGAVIAFGGRALRDDERAKYLNSPESVLFDKSGQLYALNWAREQIVSTGTAIVVEGYLDVLIPLQAGVSNVVATLGTALTDRHVRLLARYAREAVLVFDADRAGAAAAERALEIFLEQQLHVRVAAVPEGKDPCDYCLSDGPDALRALVGGAPDAMQYAWDRRLSEYRAAGGSPADRHKVVREFLRLVATSEVYGAIDELRRGQLAQHIAHMLNVPAAELQRQMRGLSRRARGFAQDASRGAAADAEVVTRDPQRIILQALLIYPELYHAVSEQISPDDFADPQLRPVAEKVWALGGRDRLTLAGVMGAEELAPLGEMLSGLVMAGERLSKAEGGLDRALARAVECILRARGDREVQRVRAGEMDDDALRRLADHHREPDVRRMPKIH